MLRAVRDARVDAVAEEVTVQGPSTIEDIRFGLIVRKGVRMTLPLPPTVAGAVAQFWRARGVRFLEVTDSRMVGRRGSLWWNAVTFDMSKLRSELTVTIDAGTGIVACTLRVNTILQSITAMNRRYWSEEMDVFESVLVRNDDRASEWRQFTRQSRKASIGWVLAIAVAVGSATIGREFIQQIFAWVAGIFGR
jgi:hypothetical protein